MNSTLLLVMAFDELFENCMATSLTHWKLCVLSVFIFVCPVTFLVTNVISYIGLNDSKDGREPPLHPYWIPFLGNWISFLLTRKTFVENVS